jgi:hypothetical protein
MRYRELVLTLCVPIALVATSSPAAAQAGDDDVTFTMTIAGEDVEEAGGSDPLRLGAETVLIELDVRNDSDDDIDLRTVRIAGSVLGFTFFSFSTRIDLSVDEDGTGERIFELDLFELERQASGLMQGTVELLDNDNEVVAREGFIVDARGSNTSTYSVFGLLVLLLTVIAVVTCVRGLRTGTLPSNRWSRALRFAEAGGGIALTIVFTLSAFRLLILPAGIGLLLLLLGIAGGGAFGYVATSAPDAAPPDEPPVDLRTDDQLLSAERPV